MNKLASWEALTDTTPTIESDRTLAVVSFPLKSAIQRIAKGANLVENGANVAENVGNVGENSADVAKNVGNGAENVPVNENDGKNVPVNVPDKINDGKNVVENEGDVVENVAENVLEKLNERQRAILNLIKTTPTLSAALLAESIGMASRTIQRDLKLMQDLGVIIHEGPDKGGMWICR